MSKLQWSPPKGKGWPSFTPDGNIIVEDDAEEPCRGGVGICALWDRRNALCGAKCGLPR